MFAIQADGRTIGTVEGLAPATTCSAGPGGIWETTRSSAGSARRAFLITIDGVARGHPDPPRRRSSKR